MAVTPRIPLELKIKHAEALGRVRDGFHRARHIYRRAGMFEEEEEMRKLYGIYLRKERRFLNAIKRSKDGKEERRKNKI